MFYSDNFCYHKFKARFLKLDELFLPLSKDILRGICPIELKCSGFVVLSKFCRMSRELFHPLHFAEVMHVEPYAGFSVPDLTGHHFMCL